MIVTENEAGTSWSELAGLDPLAAVLDPADTTGAKNGAIDRIHRRALRHAAGPLRSARVLDFGCGTGRLSRWLVSRGAVVTGIDATPEMIEVARRTVHGAEFLVGDGDPLPFPADSFDVVVTAYVLQYYVRRGDALLREVARVLRSNGRVLAIEQVGDDPTSLGRGGSKADYGRVFESAGLTHWAAKPIRLGDSRVIGEVERRPLLLHIPGLAMLAAMEARRADTPLVGARYVDVLFVARR